MNDPSRVLIAHPARQKSVYERPWAAYKAGRPVLFFTGLYYEPSKFPYRLVPYLPAHWRERCLAQLEKRRIPGFDDRLVITPGGPWLEFLLRPWNLIREWTYSFDWLMARWIKRHPVDAQSVLVHCFQESAYFTIAAAKAKGYITLLEITLPIPPRETTTSTATNGPQAWDEHQPLKIDIAAMRQADYLLAQSNFSVEVLRRWGVADSKIILLPFGVDLAQFYPAQSKNPSAPWRALFVGQLGMRKGLHHLLEAWKQLALPHAELLLVGNPNEEGRELLEKYKGLYRYAGFVPDAELPELFRQSDIFVFPSGAEGGAAVVYEALASGLPSIVTSNASAIVQDGINGYIIPWGDIETLKNRILLLYNNRDRGAEMSKAARQRAERFSWDEFDRRLNLIYDALLNGSLAGHGGVFDTSGL